MSVKAGIVKELRQRTGAGMMECKKALVECDGDLEKASQWLREKGVVSAEKKAGRITADGKIALKITESCRSGVLVEVNCETDFVARDNSFDNFVNQVADFILDNKPRSLESLLLGTLGNGETIEAAKNLLISVIGENVSVRRFSDMEASEGQVYGYLHGKKIGVLLSVVGGPDELGSDLAMHIAATNPVAIDESQLSKEILDKEREIYLSQARDAGKPSAVVDRIVEGKMKKYVSETTLLGQRFVKDAEITIEDLLENNNARVLDFVRYELGEGLEKRTDDFVGEVLAQAAGN